MQTGAKNIELVVMTAPAKLETVSNEEIERIVAEIEEQKQAEQAAKKAAKSSGSSD